MFYGILISLNIFWGKFDKRNSLFPKRCFLGDHKTPCYFLHLKRDLSLQKIFSEVNFYMEKYGYK